MTHSSRKVTKTGKASLGALTAIALAGTGLLGLSPAAAADDIVLTWRVTDSWTGGATIDATLSNRSATAVSPWSVAISGGPQFVSAWNATRSSATTVTAPGWASNLPAGSSVAFGASMNSNAAPTGCSVPGHVCRVVSTAPTPTPTPTPTTTPAPTPTQTTNPTPTPTQPQPGPGNLPTPVHFTPTSTASGTLTYHTALPYPTGTNDKLVLSSNYTDLIISNYVSGALLAKLLRDKEPGLALNRDYIYGTMFAQLLQENINTGGYNATTDWINPTATERTQLLASGQGGPYQINDYSKRLETPAGIGLINYVALQKGLGYTVEDQDSGKQTASVGPSSLDEKYFGPMAAAYFHLNDTNRLAMNNADSWGPQYATYGQCMTNLKNAKSEQAPFNNYDMILNAAYNAGTYSRILGDYFRICAGQFGTGAAATQVKSLADYSLSDKDYQAAIGT
ncbi:MAG TPA: cellulose binding domain-containing protein, partial [Actinomycetota bacterium]|nr:cellulose binding domain-containing protein [Actinomycetota bacterium]